MAKIKVNKVGLEAVPEGEREARWAAYVANYEKQNPEKYALKRATTAETTDKDGKVITVAKKDEFADIPASFL